MENTQAGVPIFNNPVPAQPQVPEATCSVRLSEKDEAQVLASAEKPPAPNEAAVRAARRLLQRDG